MGLVAGSTSAAPASRKNRRRVMAALPALMDVRKRSPGLSEIVGAIDRQGKHLPVGKGQG
jgi:hypothetical protein